jgi:hypothetical protein
MKRVKDILASIILTAPFVAWIAFCYVDVAVRAVTILFFVTCAVIAVFGWAWNHIANPS